MKNEYVLFYSSVICWIKWVYSSPETVCCQNKVVLTLSCAKKTTAMSVFALPARLIERRRSRDYLRCWKIAFNQANMVSGVKADGLKTISASVHQRRLTARNSEPLDSPERWKTGWFIKISEVHYHPKNESHSSTWQDKKVLALLFTLLRRNVDKERAAHSRAVSAPRAPTHS